MTRTSDVRVDNRDDGVAVITLDAPNRRNRINLAAACDLVAACEVLDADLSVGAAVIRAAGTVFSSGADRELLARISADPTSEENFQDLTTIYSSFARVSRLTMPTISVVQGTALGAGLNLALSTDVCLVADEGRLVSGFLSIGVHPGGGHFTLVSQRAGSQVAAAMSLFGQEFVGSAAVEAGLALEAWPAADLDERALELAAVAGANPALSRRAAESLRLQTGSIQAQTLGTRIEHAAQLWSLPRMTAG
jgi:enoyl-CoA hydratase